MQIQTPTISLTEPNSTIFRIAIIALTALAGVLGGGLVDSRLIALGVGYVVATAAIFALGPRLAWKPFVYVIAVMDLSAVTAGIVLLPSVPFPLWMLYLFPLAIVAGADAVSEAIATVICIVEYTFAIWLTSGNISLLALWPVAVLTASAFLITTLVARSLVERQQKQFWREIAAAARALRHSNEADEVAAVIAERSRRLVRAECAWVFLCDENHRLRPGPKVGRAIEQSLELELATLSPSSLRKVRGGTLPLREFGEPFANLEGEVVALRHDELLIALLVVIWHRPPRGRAALRERLRIFGRWAGDALFQAQARAATIEELRRESMLRHAAAGLAATLDSHEVHRIVVDAAHSGLGVAVSLVERPSGRVIAGAPEVTEALVELAVDNKIAGEEPDLRMPAVQQSSTPLITTVDDNLALIAWRTDPPLDESATAWLIDLTVMMQGALRRCAVYRQLQNEEFRLRASLEAMPAPFTIHDVAGKTIFANAAYRDLGVDNVPPREPPSSGILEEEVVAGDPQRIFIASTSSVVEGRYVATIYREITCEREALRAKDELIAMVGHELRSPLTSIYGYSQMMSRQLGVVQQQVGQLNRIIGDFMDAGAIQDGRIALNWQKVDLAEIARMAEERFNGAYESRKLRLELTDVPPVDGDPGRLAQVVDNLLGNAVKYSPADQEITLAIGMREGRVVISVQDHGVGIAAEYLPLLFDRFYRVPSAETENVKGLGLGLSIVHDIVTAHDGRVWAESPGPGLGSTFSVSLPTSISNDGLQRFQVKKAG